MYATVKNICEKQTILLDSITHFLHLSNDWRLRYKKSLLFSFQPHFIFMRKSEQRNFIIFYWLSVSFLFVTKKWSSRTTAYISEQQQSSQELIVLSISKRYTLFIVFLLVLEKKKQKEAATFGLATFSDIFNISVASTFEHSLLKSIYYY